MHQLFPCAEDSSSPFFLPNPSSLPVVTAAARRTLLLLNLQGAQPTLAKFSKPIMLPPNVCQLLMFFFFYFSCIFLS
jgi:hypothetical protein